jgi:hypothetical protein
MRNRYHDIVGDLNIARSHTEWEANGHEFTTDR